MTSTMPSFYNCKMFNLWFGDVFKSTSQWCQSRVSEVLSDYVESSVCDWRAQQAGKCKSFITLVLWRVTCVCVCAHPHTELLSVKVQFINNSYASNDKLISAFIIKVLIRRDTGDNDVGAVDEARNQRINHERKIHNTTVDPAPWMNTSDCLFKKDNLKLKWSYSRICMYQMHVSNFWCLNCVRGLKYKYYKYQKHVELHDIENHQMLIQENQPMFLFTR